MLPYLPTTPVQIALLFHSASSELDVTPENLLELSARKEKTQVTPKLHIHQPETLGRGVYTSSLPLRQLLYKSQRLLFLQLMNSNEKWPHIHGVRVTILDYCR